MNEPSTDGLLFEARRVYANFVAPSGRRVTKPIEIRTHPITGRTCRIAFSRIEERETGTERFPAPPPERDETGKCPFCLPQVAEKIPRINPEMGLEDRMVEGSSLLFPNLFPYGSYSAVSLFDDHHYVEIGTATTASYQDSLVNCCNYLARVRQHDPQAVYQAITQNHLPAAGGSLIHPHLQINADAIPSNYQRVLLAAAHRYHRATGGMLYSAYLQHERAEGSRYIARIGAWEWLAAFAPEGFYELWAILPETTSLATLSGRHCRDLARGILCAQRYYRSLNRNGYNFGLLVVETPASRLELRASMVVRANYAPWTRSDHSGFEVMLGDMATFSPPEETAAAARDFFADPTGAGGTPAVGK
ncbi:MAG TPA: galactose-1-phosphate uridylyltransferase [Desulfobacterales bacterium]